jgi:hypothetical protein
MSLFGPPKDEHSLGSLPASCSASHYNDLLLRKLHGRRVSYAFSPGIRADKKRSMNRDSSFCHTSTPEMNRWTYDVAKLLQLGIDGQLKTLLEERFVLRGTCLSRERIDLRMLRTDP